jgi:hypothetical protein
MEFEILQVNFDGYVLLLVEQQYLNYYSVKEEKVP